MKKVNKPVKAYKGFNKYMQCMPNGKIFQYESLKQTLYSYGKFRHGWYIYF